MPMSRRTNLSRTESSLAHSSLRFAGSRRRWWSTCRTCRGCSRGRGGSWNTCSCLTRVSPTFTGSQVLRLLVQPNLLSDDGFSANHLTRIGGSQWSTAHQKTLCQWKSFFDCLHAANSHILLIKGLRGLVCLSLRGCGALPADALSSLAALQQLRALDLAGETNRLATASLGCHG